MKSISLRLRGIDYEIKVRGVLRQTQLHNIKRAIADVFLSEKLTEDDFSIDKAEIIIGDGNAILRINEERVFYI